MKRKINTFILSALLILNPMISVYAESSINSLQSDVNQANQDINSNNNEIDEQTEKIEKLTSEIEKIEAEYEEIRTDFEKNEEILNELEEKIKDLEKEYDMRKDTANPLLVMLQKNNNINYYVELLYNDEISTVDKISTLNTLNVLSENTIRKLVKTAEVKGEVKAEKKELDEQQAELKEQGEELLAKSNEEMSKKTEALSIVTQLKTDNANSRNELLKKTGLINEYTLAGCSGNDVYGRDCGVYGSSNSVDDTLNGYQTNDKVNNTGGSYVAKLKADPNANYIINRESSWNPSATNPSSGAYGLCQALPGSKMASAGSDWRTNIETQAKWCDNYVTGRYGSWSGARAFWDRNHWF